MCGICGIVGFNSNGKADSNTISRMCRELEHRGPDDEGIYISNEDVSVGLGHRRLSIIDLSAAGHQPMANEDGSVLLVLNGEIYNYQELRQDLIKSGHRFKSNTDTETLIHLYEEKGSECVNRLRGMFAFGLWDKNKRSLLLARDRPGKKPLFYHYSNGRLCFASELSSLLASGMIEKQINHQAIDHYLAFGYIPAPHTIFGGVYKLPPAHILTLGDKGLTIERYWSIDYSTKLVISEEEAAEEVLRMLKEAVKIRLYSDVPLGAFLSGGIDSSAVVALMSEITGSRIKTFSIGFHEKRYDELRYARNIAQRFNTEHREFIVKPNVLEILPLLIRRYGEPYAESSAIPTYCVSKQTREYVTVALNGDGGDELFAGYERYQAMLIADMYQKMPGLLKGLIRGAGRILPDSCDHKNKLRRFKRFMDAAALPTTQRYLRWVGIVDESLRKELYSGDFISKISIKEPEKLLDTFLSGKVSDPLDSLLYTDTMLYLPYDLLVKVDIASMSNSLEARSPFLDHKLMEFAASLPSGFKMKNFVKKYILKKALKGLIPDENINRSKMGFGVPVGMWFRDELKDMLSENILSKKSLSRGYFNPDTVRSIFNQHLSMQKDYTFQLWALLILELWHKEFIDQ